MSRIHLLQMGIKRSILCSFFFSLESFWDLGITYLNYNIIYYFQYTFEGLPGYEVFTINVLACTIACSSPSLPLNVRTKIGCKYKKFLSRERLKKSFLCVDPSKIDQAVLTSLEQDNVVVNWKEPAIPAGKNDFYQVFLSEQHLLGDNNASDIFNVTGKFCRTMCL